MTALPVRRLRFVCEEPLKYGANAAAQYDNPKWPRFVRITDITESGELKDDTFRSLPPEVAKDYLLREGDILLARSGSVGRSFIYKAEWGEACFAGYLVRARLSEEFDRRFVYWSLNTLNYWSWIESTAIRSTIQNVSAHRYAEFAVPAPPLDTQRRIARFLDEKTAQIDGLIEKKRALLDRLAEKRQTLITRAVTKGLNPDAPMKPTGIDWLGDIPVHWEVLPLKRMLARSTYGISASLEPSGEIAVLRMGNLVDGEIDLSDLGFLDEIDEDLLLDLNDVLFNRTNSLDLVGKASIFRGSPSFPVSLASYLVRFRFTERYNPEVTAHPILVAA